jgi:hypothetical protein
MHWCWLADSVGVDRQGLTRALVAAASAAHPDRITFLWETRPSHIDLVSHTITIP